MNENESTRLRGAVHSMKMESYINFERIQHSTQPCIQNHG